MFRHYRRAGRAFPTAGMPGLPILEVDQLSFRHRKDLSNMRNLFDILSKLPKLKSKLDTTTTANDKNRSLKDDLKWRAEHLRVPRNRGFWELSRADVPAQLSEALLRQDDGPLWSTKLHWTALDRSCLSTIKNFEDAHLVTAPFRCFNRADGEIGLSRPIKHSD